MITEELEDVKDEPMSPDELLKNLLEDMILGNSPEMLASDFINEFVLRDREETPQILILLEQPTESIVTMLGGFITEANRMQLQALSERGDAFIDGLKVEVKKQMTEIANS